jgi:hypothetical protein
MLPMRCARHAHRWWILLRALNPRQGIKDMDKIAQFCKAVRDYDNS